METKIFGEPKENPDPFSLKIDWWLINFFFKSIDKEEITYIKYNKVVKFLINLIINESQKKLRLSLAWFCKPL